MVYNMTMYKNKTQSYSFAKGLIKGVVSVILFSIPFALNATPEAYLNLTIGGVLTIAFNALKFYYNENFM